MAVEKTWSKRSDFAEEYSGGSGFVPPGAGSGRITEVSDPGGKLTRKVLRFELKKTDTFPTASPRAQLNGGETMALNGTFYLGFRLWIPSLAEGGPPLITEWGNVWELFGRPYEGSPTVSLGLIKEGAANVLEFHRTSKYGFDHPWRKSFSTGQWINFVYHFKLSSKASGGFVELWVNGVQQTFDFATYNPKGEAATTKLLMDVLEAGNNDGKPNEHIPQLYRSAGSFEPYHVYYDKAVQATTKAEAEYWESEEKEEPPPEEETGKAHFVEKVKVEGKEQTSLSVARPGKKGDLIVVLPMVSANKTITVASGTTTVNESKAQKYALEEKIGIWSFLHDGKTDAISVTWAGSEKKYAQALVLVYREVDQSTPMPVVGEYEEHGKGKTHACPAITTGAANELVVAYLVEGSGYSATPPSGMTERQDEEADIQLAHVADVLQAAAGSTGSKTFDFGAKEPVNSIGILFAIKTIVAASEPPTCSTGSASGIGQLIATLNGTVNPKGKATEYRFEYGPTTSYGTNTGWTSAGSGKEDVVAKAELSGLTPASTYHFRVSAKNADGEVHGSDATFKTLAETGGEEGEEEPAPENGSTRNFRTPIVPKLSLPLRLEQGRFAVVEQDSEDEVAQCVYAIMATPRGHRIDDPEFGVEDPTFDQLPVDEDEWLSQIAEYEPRADIVTAQEVVDLTDTVTMEVGRR